MLGIFLHFFEVTTEKQIVILRGNEDLSLLHLYPKWSEGREEPGLE